MSPKCNPFKDTLINWISLKKKICSSKDSIKRKKEEDTGWEKALINPTPYAKSCIQNI